MFAHLLNELQMDWWVAKIALENVRFGRESVEYFTQRCRLTGFQACRAVLFMMFITIGSIVTAFFTAMMPIIHVAASSTSSEEYVIHSARADYSREFGYFLICLLAIWLACRVYFALCLFVKKLYTTWEYTYVTRMNLFLSQGQETMAGVVSVTNDISAVSNAVKKGVATTMKIKKVVFGVTDMIMIASASIAVLALCKSFYDRFLKKKVINEAKLNALEQRLFDTFDVICLAAVGVVACLTKGKKLAAMKAVWSQLTTFVKWIRAAHSALSLYNYFRGDGYKLGGAGFEKQWEEVESDLESRVDCLASKHFLGQVFGDGEFQVLGDDSHIVDTGVRRFKRRLPPIPVAEEPDIYDSVSKLFDEEADKAIVKKLWKQVKDNKYVLILVFMSIIAVLFFICKMMKRITVTSAEVAKDDFCIQCSSVHHVGGICAKTVLVAESKVQPKIDFCIQCSKVHDGSCVRTESVIAPVKAEAATNSVKRQVAKLQPEKVIPVVPESKRPFQQSGSDDDSQGVADMNESERLVRLHQHQMEQEEKYNKYDMSPQERARMAEAEEKAAYAKNAPRTNYNQSMLFEAKARDVKLVELENKIKIQEAVKVAEAAMQAKFDRLIAQRESSEAKAKADKLVADEATRLKSLSSKKSELKKNVYTCSCKVQWTSAQAGPMTCNKCKTIVHTKSTIANESSGAVAPVVKEAAVKGNLAFNTLHNIKHICAVENLKAEDPKYQHSCGTITYEGVLTTKHTCTGPQDSNVTITLKAQGGNPQEVLEYVVSDAEEMANDLVLFRFKRSDKNLKIFARYNDPVWVKANKLEFKIPGVGDQSQVIGFAGKDDYLSKEFPPVSAAHVLRVIADSKENNGLMEHGASTAPGFSGCPIFSTEGKCIGIHSRSCESTNSTYFIPFSAEIRQLMSGGKKSFQRPPSQA